MRFATKQDIEAPIAEVFRIMTDFESWERAAMRRGADVSRTDKLRVTAPGMSWLARFSYRSKPRDVQVQLTSMETPIQLGFSGESQAIGGVATIELMEMSAKRTRMHLVMELTPRSLTARLFLQSLRLARARVDRKFDQRVAQLAADIETRYRATRKF